MSKTLKKYVKNRAKLCQTKVPKTLINTTFFNVFIYFYSISIVSNIAMLLTHISLTVETVNDCFFCVQKKRDEHECRDIRVS